jgi:hypothetical protein
MLERSLYYRATVILSLALIFAAIESLSAGKAGSNANYFMEVNFIAAALAGLFLFRVLAGAQRRPAGASMAIYVLTLGAAICAIAPAIAPLSPHYRAMNRGAVETYQRALEAVRNIRGPVYSEEMTLLMNSGKEVPAEHSSITGLARTGRWGETPFLNMILQHRFAAIVTTNIDLPERYSPRVKQAIQQAYELEKTIGPYVFRTPRR